MVSQEVAVGQMRELIVEVLKSSEPKTTAELVKLLQQKSSLPEKEVIRLLIQFKDENQILFKKRSLPQQPATFGAYLFSFKSFWFWFSLVLTIVTAVAVFTIGDDVYPLVYVRQITGLVFVLFLPGFVLLKALYPSTVPIPTSSETLDKLERTALSIGLSISLIAISGLVLNYTPWGIRLTPVTLSLSALIVVFATIGLLREFSIVLNMPMSNSISNEIKVEKHPKDNLQPPMASAVKPDISSEAVPAQTTEPVSSKILTVEEPQKSGDLDVLKNSDALALGLQTEKAVFTKDELAELKKLLSDEEAEAENYFDSLRREIQKIVKKLDEKKT
ncbi:MAG: DUF1616 domain-containing protein [Candidatus Bathyarchaeota archaeon]|nr:DUF1616 domain-containing protein [Candidatus Bathyarchaeota archaeon]